MDRDELIWPIWADFALRNDCCDVDLEHTVRVPRSEVELALRQAFDAGWVAAIEAAASALSWLAVEGREPGSERVALSTRDAIATIRKIKPPTGGE